MNDIILMSMMGGRYLEAEDQTNRLLIQEPTSENYFLMGTIKSNLLFGKGRDLSEALFCFEKSLKLVENNNQLIIDTGAFLFGIYKQIEGIEEELKKAVNNKLWKSLAGIALTYFSSKVIDNAEKSFGIISGMVGAGFGVGMAIGGLSEIGDVVAQLEFVKNLKSRLELYLKENFPKILEKLEPIVVVEIDLEKIRNFPKLFPSETFTFDEIIIDIAPKKPELGIEGLKKVGITSENSLFFLKTTSGNLVAFLENNIVVEKGIVVKDYYTLPYSSVVSFKLGMPKAIESFWGIELSFSAGKKFFMTKYPDYKEEEIEFGNKNLIIGTKDVGFRKPQHLSFFKTHDFTQIRDYFWSCFSSN
jgi:hypothetical protein